MSFKGGTSADKSLSVPEYSRQFFERILKGNYGETLEENRKVAGENFISLVKKLQEAGSKDDVKVPLRVLRDEIGRQFFSGVGHKKAENIETLFMLYDMLEADCQETLKAGHTVPPKEAAAATQLLDELRNRFVRLAVGETWDKTPELKYLALKRMYKYMVREQELLRLKGKLGIPGSGSGGSAKFNQKFMRSITMSPGGATWQLALDDLVKAPSNKLFPFVKLLLAENLLLENSATSGVASTSDDAETLKSGSSNAKDASAVARGTSDFSLDDLLGLGTYPSTPGASDSAPDTPASDPFKPTLETGQSQPIDSHTFEAEFPDPEPATAPAPPTPASSSNPFGASSFGQPSFATNHTPAVPPPQRAGSSGTHYPPLAAQAGQVSSVSAPGAFPAPQGGSAGPSRSSSAIAAMPPVPAPAPARTSSGAGFPPPSPTASGDGFGGGSAFAAGPGALRSFSASSEAEVVASPVGSGALPAAVPPPAAPAQHLPPPTPTNSASLGEQAFPTSFLPPPAAVASILQVQQHQISSPVAQPSLSTAGSSLGSPMLQHAGSGGVATTPTPALKAPPGPVRQLSGAFSPPRPAALVRANSSGPQGGLARAASGAFPPPLRTASLGGAGSGSSGPEGLPPAPVAPKSLSRGNTSGSEGGSGHFVAPPLAPLQAAAPGSGDHAAAAAAAKPFAPPQQTADPSPFQNLAAVSQAPQPQFAAFEGAAFANGSADDTAKHTFENVQIPASEAQGAASSFNPFGLPSPSFASPVPPFADNRFADVSPMSNAPPPPVPQPMRAPPAPPGHAPTKQFSAW